MLVISIMIFERNRFPIGFNYFFGLIIVWLILGSFIHKGICATLTWDASGITLPNPSDGSGGWLTAGNWWNGAENINGTWSGSTPDSALFGAGAAGNYTINLGGGTITASNVTFATSGYTLTNGTLAFVGSGPHLVVNTGVVATVNSIANPASLSVGSGGILNLGGGANGFLSSAATGAGTVNFISPSAKTFTTTGNQSWNIGDPAALTGGMVVSNNSTFSEAGSFVVGASGSSGLVTINSPSAVYNITGTGATLLGRNGGSSKGRLRLINGLLNAGSSTGVRVGYQLSNGSATSEFDIIGGMYLQNNPLLILENSTLATATVNMTGGAAILGGINFGNGSSSGTANFTMSGGTMYLSSGGITNLSTGSFATTITLSGGTMGADSSWTSLMPMTLSGNIIFQAADTNNNPQNITLGGTLSGFGGLAKTGGGTLTLSRANTYGGGTTINAGTLMTTTASSGAGSYNVAGNAVLDVTVAAAGSSLNMSSLTLNGGSTLNLDPGSFGNPTSPLINVAGTLNATSTVTINLAGSGLAAGQFPVIKYGTLGGNGFNAFHLGNLTGAATLINDVVNHSIDLNISTLTWDGSINGNWDIGMTANWQGASVYTETNGNGPSVIFNDSASGTSAVILNTIVSPSSITVNNSTRAYSLSGFGKISGDSSLVKQGTNVLVVTTTNDFVNQFGDYSTTISGGTLQLGDGAAADGSVAGNIDDEAILTVANPDDQLLSNNIDGAGMLIKSGAGKLMLSGANTYTGGTTINAGTLAVGTMNNVSMAYTNNGATLYVTAMGTTPLPVSNLKFSSSSQITFDMGYTITPPSAVVNVSGNVVMNGNVTVNVTNAAPIGTNVLLSYSGSRIGTGNFVAGVLPNGANIVDDPVNKKVSLILNPTIRVFIPTLNTNEIVVSAAAPQDFGAKGDGITDDSAAFQKAMNWTYNSNHWGGGVVFVPNASYAFYTNLTIPTGVTLHGDWKDWTKSGNELVGTTFKIYFGEGHTNDPAFIFMNGISSIKGINFWYPNQDAANITGYPYTIQINGGTTLQNIVLVNSYQGIVGNANARPAQHILSTIIGSPLLTGISIDFTADIIHTEDVRFSPDVWPQSGLSNAPALNGPHAAWMRANGTGMKLYRIDGQINLDTFISGYNVGILAAQSTNGAPTANFYNGSISNCAIAVDNQTVEGQSGLMFTRFVLDGDVGVYSPANTQVYSQFHSCQITGRNGPAAWLTGPWNAWMQFQNCTISNRIQVDGGVANLVNCTLLGSTQCVMSSSAIRAGFTGCSFSPSQKIINNGSASHLLMDSRHPLTNVLPIVDWTNIVNDYLSRRPARTNLFVVTAFGAIGNGTNDDTIAIQNALNAAGDNGGGIVYLPGGKYRLTDTLDVPSGVEMRGVHELRSSAGTWPDGRAKASVLQPYAGQGTTNGPVAVALEANSGLVGLNFSYETQNTNIIPFPPMIQGRGGNVYAISVVCPNAYTFMDLDTYTCTNHFVYLADGWAINRGFVVGNGSSGSIVCCQDNITYWNFNGDSTSVLTGTADNIFTTYAQQNLESYVLGDCTELLVGDFNIPGYTFLHTISENGRSPNVTGVGALCDVTTQGVWGDSSTPSAINLVNSTFAITDHSGLGLNTVGITTSPNFQGTLQMFNWALFGGIIWDITMYGGDVRGDLVHMYNHSFNGSQVFGGVLHMVNTLSYDTTVNANPFPVYNVAFGTNAGIQGRISEIIGSAAYNGYSYANPNTNNPVNVWNNYAFNNASLLTKTNVYQSFQPDFPPLTLQLFNSPLPSLNLQWPYGSGYFNVYETTNLSPPVNWSMVNVTPVLSNGLWNVNVPATANVGFYRLSQ